MAKLLRGLKILDLSRFISGPYTGMLLGDLGADVVKLEKAGSGDDTRSFEPKINGESIYTFVMNRNKRSLEINYRTQEGQELLRRLVKEADVLIENFRPGTMDKMGCGWETLHQINPRLIMVSISGFGAKGPYRDKPGFDAAIQAMSGLMSVTGEADGPPLVHGTYTVDHVTAVYAALSVLAACIARQETGRGQLIELSLLECAATMLLCGIPSQAVLGETMQRTGNLDRYLAPGNCYRTRDNQYLFLLAGSDAHFKLLCEAMDNPGLLRDERFDSQEKRMQNRDAIETIVQAWTQEKTAAELQALLDRHGLVSSRVENLKDLVENPQLRYRGKLVEMDHPVMGKVPMMGAPYTFSDMELDLSRPSPTLGQHSEAVLKEWLGCSDGQIRELKDNGAITAKGR